jgi:hypothetical protein
MPAKPAVTVTEAEVLQLTKILRLLASDQVGERAAAALKANAWVQARGLDWQTLLLPEPPPPPKVSVSVGGQSHETLQAEALMRQATALLREARDKRQEAEYCQGVAEEMRRDAERKLAELRAAQLAASVAGVGVSPVRPVPVAAANQPAWGALVDQMLADHAPLIRSPKERQFLLDQQERALRYGGSARLTERQEAWLRAILQRAGMDW